MRVLTSVLLVAVLPSALALPAAISPPPLDRPDRFGPADAVRTAEAGGVGTVAADTPVGTIQMTVDGETLAYEVREGSPRDGFSTGYRMSYRGESEVIGASLHGFHASGAEVVLTVGVWREGLEHMCDPFANQVRLSAGDEGGIDGRLRPSGGASESCPDLNLEFDLTEATFDEEAGTVRVEGRFAGPLGREEGDPRVSEATFRATLRDFDELMGGG